MNAPAVKSPILRAASGEPPLGPQGLSFRDEQGEIFEPDNPRQRSQLTRIGVLELVDGGWLAMPPGFRVDMVPFGSRGEALRHAVAAMVRRAQTYAGNAEGEGAHWTRDYADAVIRWARSLLPAEVAENAPCAADGDPRRAALVAISRGEPVLSEMARDLVGEGLAHATATSLVLTEEGLALLARQPDAAGEPPAPMPATDQSFEPGARDNGGSPAALDPIVRALCEANRARRIYPAGHIFSMTNPIINGQMVTMGTCSCGESFSYKWGNYELMDAAIEAHRQTFDHLPEKVDGRGNPIEINAEERAAESPEARQPKKKRSRRSAPKAGDIPELANAALPEPALSLAPCESGAGSTSSPNGADVSSPTPALAAGDLATPAAGAPDLAGAGPTALRSEPAPEIAPSNPPGAGSPPYSEAELRTCLDTVDRRGFALNAELVGYLVGIGHVSADWDRKRLTRAGKEFLTGAPIAAPSEAERLDWEALWAIAWGKPVDDVVAHDMVTRGLIFRTHPTDLSRGYTPTTIGQERVEQLRPLFDLDETRRKLGAGKHRAAGADETSAARTLAQIPVPAEPAQICAGEDGCAGETHDEYLAGIMARDEEGGGFPVAAAPLNAEETGAPGTSDNLASTAPEPVAIDQPSTATAPEPSLTFDETDVSGEALLAEPDDLAIDWPSYDVFLEDKIVTAPLRGIEVARDALHPYLKPHCKDLVVWGLRLGCAAIFASFGLHKTAMQLEWCRQLVRHTGQSSLTVVPLGVRHGFIKEALSLDMDVRFIRTNDEYDALYCEGVRHFLTNYESIREGKLDPNLFEACSLDEASVLRSYGSKTFQEFLPLFAKVPFKLVATATPSPNRYKELIHYAGFLGVMDTGLALTRWFQRNSEKAGDLTLYPHKQDEFWMWVHSWAAFLQKPSELGYSDEGYELPPLKLTWHEVPADHSKAAPERDGQSVMFRDVANSLSEAARARRDSLPARIARMVEIIAQDPDSHRIIWHDLEAEREAIEQALPDVVTITGSMDIDAREARLHDFEEGRTRLFGTKPILSGSGSNFQYHCHKAIYVALPGYGYKFNDFIQSLYRLQRFGQQFPVEVDIIYAEDERAGRAALEEKWALDAEMRKRMSEIILRHGLNTLPLRDALLRTMGIQRVEIRGARFVAINNDAVAECRTWPENSVDLMVSSIPFGTQYEYSACYDEQTEVLTRRGWHSFGAITTDDHLATLNPETLEIEWQAPSEVTWHAYSGPMLHFAGRNSHDLLVTPNHKMFVDTRVGNRKSGRKVRKFDLVRADHVEATFARRKYLMVSAGRGKNEGHWPAYIDVPKVKQRIFPNSRVIERIETADFMRLAGWYLSEGHCRKGRGRAEMGTISITQSASANPENRREIIDLMRRVGLRAREEKANHNIVGWSIPLAEFLRTQFGAGSYVKRIPRWVKDLHPDLLRILRDTMMKGDGTERGFSYTSFSLQLRDDFQELCLLTGWRSCVNVRNQSVWIGQTNLFPEIREKPRRVHYTGMIGCATVPNHTLVVRRNGKAIVCGNSYRDFGHTDDASHFWGQMDFLSSELLRMLKPGRLACIHVKDRVLFGGVTGQGVPTIAPFHAEAIMHYRAHGFQYLGMITVVTDVVRENNQTYRLGWSENAKDGTKMGVGMPEYILLLRKPQSDRSKSYADVPVVKSKEDYTRARWQVDAHAFWRSSGNRHLTPEEFALLGPGDLARLFAKTSLDRVYDFEAHVRIGEHLERQDLLPATFMSIAPGSQHPDVWHDVNRMRTLNMNQQRKGQEMHLCPLQFDIVDRLIERYSNPDDLVFDPFGGLMTVPYRALLKGRRGAATELSPSYFLDGVHYLHAAEEKLATPQLFDLAQFDAANTPPNGPDGE